MSVQLDIQEIVVLVNAFQVAMNKGVYSKEEMGKFFPAWNNLTAALEKQQRQQAVDQNYRERSVVKISEEVQEEEKEDNSTVVEVPE
jgi:hypothetical protein